MYRRILLPVDGSEAMETVVEHTADIASRRGATVHVLYVVDDRAFLTLSEDRTETALEQMHAEGERALDRAAARLDAAGVPVTTATRQGNPADQILSYVEDANVDLVTMGTHGADAQRTLLGSVSQRVVTMSPVPVLTVNVTDTEEPDEDDTGEEDEAEYEVLN